MFVSYCFYNAGLPLPITTPKGFAYCPYGVKWFRNKGWWHTDTKGVLGPISWDAAWEAPITTD